MNNNTHLSKSSLKANQILFITLFASISFFLSYKFYYLSEKEKIINSIYTKQAKEIKKYFRDEVYSNFDRNFALTYMISKQDILKKALLKNDNTLLDFSKQIEKIETLEDYNNLWIQVIDKNGDSFYRSWTEHTGDSLINIRSDIKRVIQHPEELLSISVGRYDMTFKSIIPIYDTQNNFIGSVEIASKFNSIISKLEEYGIKTIALAHEKYKKQFYKPYSNIFIGDNYLVHTNVSDNILKKFKHRGLHYYLKNDGKREENLFIVTDIIKDINKKDMGYFIFFLEHDKIDFSQSYRFLIEYFIKVIMVLVMLIIVILAVATKEYAKKLLRSISLN